MKNKNIFELDPERLATTDERGNRIFLYPEDVKGIWKNRRQKVYWILISIYLILPWIYIEGRPALQVNFLEREFTFFGQVLYGIEPVLFFLLVASGLFFIGFVTSLWGRVWCGWACPQTVFIQSLFMKVEALFEGSARERRSLDQRKWDLDKIFRRLSKWIVFLLISSHIAHTFIGYVVGPRELFFITTQAPAENWGLFLATWILTLIFFLDFGWFREQFCIIACPYGRMQSVLMDENSLVVSYDPVRGEPRRNPGVLPKENEGDCINCYNCVKVCPTGIDIRRGTQLECIACTQCIDACDSIMEKLKKPRGLIRYASENEMEGRERKRTLRPFIYLTILFFLLGLFFYFLNQSTNINMVFIRSKVPFTVTPDEKIVTNHFTLKITHQGETHYLIEIKAAPELERKVEIVTNQNPIPVSTPVRKNIVFIRFPRDLLVKGSRKIEVYARDAESQKILSKKEVTLVGPVD